MSEQETTAYEIAVLYEEARRRREEGNSSGAFARYRRLLELADQRQDLRWRAELQAEVGDMYQRVCETVPARHWYEQALLQFETLGDGDSAARMHLHLGEISQVEGDLAAAQAHFEAAESAQAVELSSLAMAHLGALVLTQGREREGLALLCEAFGALREHPEQREVVQRRLEQWARQLTPTRFRRLLARATSNDSLRSEIESLIQKL